MNQKPTLRTSAQVRAEFERQGVSVAEWAREHKVGSNLVREVLRGRPCRRGQSHRIAVLLGLKEGELARSPRAVNAPAKRKAA